MKPFISANCKVLHDNIFCDATVIDVNTSTNTFSVEDINPETGKFSQMLNICFSKFRLILYYTGLNWVSRTYVYEWLDRGERVKCNNGVIRNWYDIINEKTDLYINKQKANNKIIDSYMSKTI